MAEAGTTGGHIGHMGTFRELQSKGCNLLDVVGREPMEAARGDRPRGVDEGVDRTASAGSATSLSSPVPSPNLGPKLYLFIVTIYL